jgi:uncharacterized membrane protein YhaH (DUF805 family)
MSFETTFAYPAGRTSRGGFILALVVLLAVTAFYYFLVKAGRNGQWVLATLLFPAFVLHARRLHDMGMTAWLLVIPGALDIAFAWFVLSDSNSALLRPVGLAALAVTAAFALWGLVGKGQAESNKFGEPAAG